MRESPPWRGHPNPTTKKDNNAIFFGAPGTGKSATVKKICIEANECPLIMVKGSSLTPTKQDYDAEEEVEVKDESGNPTTETDEIEIEIGEFLQFFWQKKESGQLSSYDGEFESPRIPKEAEVLNDNLPNLAEMANVLAKSSNALTTSLENLNQEVQGLKQQIQISMSSQSSGAQTEIMQLQNAGKAIGTAVGVALAPATGGTSLLVCGGIGFLAGSALDADIQKKENENKQLNLKGEISKQIREEINNLQNERSQEASQLNNLDQQIAQKQNKLNDPSTSEQEKAQIRSELASLVSQRSDIQGRIKGLDEKIESLIKQAKEELEDIKQITNSQKQQEKVNSAFEKHSRNFLNAQGLLNSYNINGEVNMNDF
ncbi:8250_t:CDS:2 [Paraglomus brasilianum]|uniref:8250_t:CDS:1 n=1 Tax=Paraglomus brasilianum TaxID=144538 RepID=A0A9N9DN13_9GLOM|nr:8250_t:CDS:2 [Paraglomus brasilianum]